MTVTVADRTRVHGHGLVAAVVARRLAAREHEAAAPDTFPAVVVCVASAHELGDVAVALGAQAPDAVLTVGLWRSWAYVGPFWRPGTPGCPHCLSARVADSPIGPDRQERELTRLGLADATGLSAGPALPHIVAELVAARLDAAADHAGADDWARGVTICDTQTGTADTHVLEPDALCPVCGPAQRGTLPEFADRAHPITKPAPATLRVRPIAHDPLLAQVSPVGLFRRLRVDLQSPFGASSIELPQTQGRQREPAMGRARSYRDSGAVAVLEGLERYCGLHRGGRRRTVRAAYRDIAADAVYPPSFGAHPAASHALSWFPYREFSPDTVVDWVEAFSFARNRSVLVPERVAFWGTRYDAEPTFFYETSNGCALGGCTEEAVLHGLLELVERDSFLLTWYRRLALPELDLRGDPDPELRAVLRKCELFARCTFRAFVSTMEHGIPSVWLTAERHDRSGPAVLAGAAAHPDLRQAVIGGVFELTKRVNAIAHYYAERRDEALPMLDDSFLVRRLEHHPMVNCLPEARDRFAFLLERDASPIAFADAAPNWIPDTDLRTDLSAAVRSLLGVGLDVLAVDQTMPELARHGLACVKVLVPGLLPMTFGHVNRRTAHLPRLAKTNILPYAGTVPPGDDAAYVPHPFD